MSNIIVDKDMSADLVTHLLLAGVVRRYDLPDGKRNAHSLEPLSSNIIAVVPGSARGRPTRWFLELIAAFGITVSIIYAALIRTILATDGTPLLFRINSM